MTSTRRNTTGAPKGSPRRGAVGDLDDLAERIADATKRGKSAEQLIAEQRQRDHARVLYRLRRHLRPLGAALAVSVLGGGAWVAHALAGPQWAALGTAAVTFGTVAAVVGFARGSLPERWRARLVLAGLAASVWVTVAAWRGLDLTAGAALYAGTLALSARYWQTLRTPYPTGKPAPEQADRADTSVIGMWLQNVGSTSGVLPGSYLTGERTTKVGAEYTIELVPGKHTLSDVLNALPRIGSGIGKWPHALVAEQTPDADDEMPSRVRLTIVERSPVKETSFLEAARWDCGYGGGILPIGPYVDGQGFAPWRLWTPGPSGYDSTDQDGSAWSGVIIAGTGSGKSELAQQLVAHACSTGLVTPWFIDPQGGVSSPALQAHADWYVNGADAWTMLGAAERIIEARGVENVARGRESVRNGGRPWTGFRPTTERPLLMIVIDEAHQILRTAKDGARLAASARMARKVGVLYVLISQVVDLSTFGGSDALRASVMAGNGVIMRTESRQTGTLMAGLEVDPMTLPKLPGYGYTTANGHARLAPFRTQVARDAFALLAAQQIRPLDDYAAAAAGADYTGRAQGADELAAAAETRMAAILAGRWTSTTAAADDLSEAEDVDQVGEFTPVTFPAAPPEVRALAAVPVNARDAVWNALRTGEPRRTGELVEAAGYSDTAIRKALAGLVDAGRVVKVGHGTWQRADAAQAAAQDATEVPPGEARDVS